MYMALDNKDFEADAAAEIHGLGQPRPSIAFDPRGPGSLLDICYC